MLQLGLLCDACVLSEKGRLERYAAKPAAPVGVSSSGNCKESSVLGMLCLFRHAAPLSPKYLSVLLFVVAVPLFARRSRPAAVFSTQL